MQEKVRAPQRLDAGSNGTRRASPTEASKQRESQQNRCNRWSVQREQSVAGHVELVRLAVGGQGHGLPQEPGERPDIHRSDG